MAQFTEEEKTIRRIEKRFNKGMVQYGLIEEGDKVLVGLSGGKDSLALVELLGKRSHIFKPRFSGGYSSAVLQLYRFEDRLAGKRYGGFVHHADGYPDGLQQEIIPTI